MLGHTDYPCREAKLVPALISQPPHKPIRGTLGILWEKAQLFFFKTCRIGTIFNGFSVEKDVLKEQFGKNLN